MTSQSPQPGARDPAAPPVGNGRHRSTASGPAAELRAVSLHLGEAAAYGKQFISAKFARMSYGFRKLAMLSMIGAVVGVAGVSFLVTCAVLLALGISDGVAMLLPDGYGWLGKLIVGFGGVAAATLIVYIVLRRAAAAGKKLALEQYRTALRDQRKKFGHDAFSRSAADAADKHLKARTARARTPEQVADLREKQVQAYQAQEALTEDFSRLKGK
jgi:hypothetical protein